MRELGFAALGLLSGGVIIIVALVMASFVRNIIATIDNVVVANTATWTKAYNATNALIDALALFISIYPLIVIAVGFSIVLMYVTGFIGGGSMGGGSGRRGKR